MKLKILSIIVFYLSIGVVFCQEKNGSFEKDASGNTKIPRLQVLSSSFRIVEEFEDGKLNAGENFSVSFDVVNKGSAIANSVKLSIKQIKSRIRSQDIIVHGITEIGDVKPNETKVMQLNFTSNLPLTDGVVTFEIGLLESAGFDSEILQLDLNTSHIDIGKPALKLSGHSINGVSGYKGLLKRLSPVNFKITLKNIGFVAAKSGEVSITLPQGVILLSENSVMVYDVINPEEEAELEYELFISGQFDSHILVLEILVKDEENNVLESWQEFFNVEQIAPVQKVNLSSLSMKADQDNWSYQEARTSKRVQNETTDRVQNETTDRVQNETTEGEDGLIIPTENTYALDLNTAPAKVFDFAEEKATYPGGEEAMYAELLSNVVYPEMEKTNQIEGTVYVNFVVEADGSVSNVTVLRGVEEGPGFNKAAIIAVTKLKKKFVPAKMNGNQVRLRMTIPVRFSLK